MVALDRLILVAVTGGYKDVAALTLPKIRAFAYRCNAELMLLTDTPQWCKDGKYRIFEAGHTVARRTVCMDADLLPRDNAPDIYEMYPEGNYMLDEGAYRGHPFEAHRREVEEYLVEAGMSMPQWPEREWWNPGICILDGDAAREIFRLPPWDITEKLFTVEGVGVVKNMPIVNANIALSGVEVRPIDPRWNVFMSAPPDLLKSAYCWHCACSEVATNRPESKIQIIKNVCTKYKEPLNHFRVHCVISRDQHNWILGRMWRAIQETAPEGAICTDGERPINQAGVINYYNPYRGYRHKTQGHDVVFCTHPEIPTTWARATRDADHIVVMADKWRQHLIEQGVPAHKITHVPPGVDGWFLDSRLRIFNACKMPDGSYGARKGRQLWQRLCAEPWLECICSGGAMSEAELRLQYLACDVVVSTAVPDYGGEGGPMSCKEGLALCKPTVMPAGIGLVDEHADHPCLLRYPAGDYDALIEMLRALYHTKVNVKMAATDWTWEAWGKAHWDIFNRLIPGLAQPQAAPQARRVKDKIVPLYFGDNQRDKSEILEYVTNKGFIPVEADAPEGAIDLTAVAGKPVFARNRYIKQQLGAYK